MRILVGVGHPAHVHFFKNVIWELKRRGNEVLVAARDKDVTLALLNAYGFSYRKVSRQSKGTLGLFWEYIEHEYALYKLVRRFQPDILTEVGGIFVAPLGRVVARPAVVFTDSESVPIDKVLMYPLASVICTPGCFKKNLGAKHVRYDGYQELAYLHPRYFTPDHGVLKSLGLREGERFSILRFVAWGASHDMGQRGVGSKAKYGLVRELGKYGRVLISSEGELPSELESYRIAISPEKIHNLLYYSSLCLTEGATMATEAGLLGTPSVYVSSLASALGNFDELMNKYGLVYSFKDPQRALESALKLLQDKDARQKWQEKQERLLREKIDVTQFVVELLENYLKPSMSAKPGGYR
jgi:predicted glycosyltransferase